MVKRINYSSIALLAVSSCLSLFIFFRGHISCFSDSIEFLIDRYTQLPVGHYNIDPAYRLLIWLSGFSFTHSLLLIFIFQSVMAALMPLLVYGTVRPFSKRGSIIAGWVTLISLIPFLFQLNFYNDQLYAFLLLLCCYVSVRSIIKNQIKNMYMVIICFGLLFLCRPVYISLMPLLIFLLIKNAFFTKKISINLKLLNLAKLSLVFILVTSVTFWLRFSPTLFLKSNPEVDNNEMYNGFNNMSSIQLFSHLYMHTRDIPKVFQPSDGPYTQDFLDKMANFLVFNDSSTTVQKIKQYTSRYTNVAISDKNSAQVVLQTYLQHPSYDYTFLDDFFFHYGSEGNKIASKLYFEQIKQHPLIAVNMIYSGMRELLLSQYMKYHANDKYFQLPWQPTVYFEPLDVRYGCQANYGINEFINWDRHTLKSIRHFDGIYAPFYKWFVIITEFFSILGILLYGYYYLKSEKESLLRQESLSYFVILFLYWLPNITMMFLVLIIFRYQAICALLPLIMAALVVTRGTHLVKSLIFKL